MSIDKSVGAGELHFNVKDSIDLVSFDSTSKMEVGNTGLERLIRTQLI